MYPLHTVHVMFFNDKRQAMGIINFVSEFKEIPHLVDNVCTVGGLLPGKTYAFRVKAKNEAGVRANK